MTKTDLMEYNYKIDTSNKKIKSKSLDILDDKIIIDGISFEYDDIQFILARAALSKRNDLKNGDILAVAKLPPIEHLKGYIEIQFLNKMYRFINIKDVMEKYSKLAKKVSDCECYYVCDQDRALYRYELLL